MSDENPRKFDLNIEKILEGWEVCHALREVIANALDEQALTDTRDVTIAKDSRDAWHTLATWVRVVRHRGRFPISELSQSSR